MLSISGRGFTKIFWAFQNFQKSASFFLRTQRRMPSLFREEELAKRSVRELAYRSTQLAHDALFFSRASSDAVAVVETERETTYRDLAGQGRWVATRLHELSSDDVDYVGFMMDRSVTALAAIYGILLFGAAYVPVDASWSKDRKRAVLDSVSLVVVQHDDRLIYDWLSRDRTRAVLTLSSTAGMQDSFGGVCSQRRPKRTKPGDPVYLAYTSGSSGPPKGVVVPHGALVSRLASMEALFALTDTGRLFCKTSYCFGVSEWEVFWPSFVGAVAVLAPQGVEADPARTWALCHLTRSTHVFFVSSALREAIVAAASTSSLQHQQHHRESSLKHVIQCGEALDAALCAEFYEVVSWSKDKCQLTNLYGPTEASMTAWTVPRQIRPKDRVLVGWPIHNTIAIVVDSQMRPTPVGESGELCFGGVLATGYFGDRRTTDDKFVRVDICSSLTQEVVDYAISLGAVALDERRLYRTGDAAIRQVDGSLRLLGRIDRQVKIAGKRVELGEIEAEVRSSVCPEAREVAAVVQDGERVVAFVVVESPFPRRVEKLAGGLPVLVTSIPSIPRLASGKQDLLSLSRYIVDEMPFADEDDGWSPSHSPSSLAAFTKSRRGEALRAAGFDSLGIAKAHRLDAARRREHLVLNAFRVWATFGVVLDHWNLDGTIFPLVDANVTKTPSYLVCDLILRSIGNAQSLFLFVVADAIDAANRRDHEGDALVDKRDATTFALYVAMRWPIPQMLCLGNVRECATCFASRYKDVLRPIGVDRDWDVLAVHRWYLYLGLVARFVARTSKRLVGRRRPVERTLAVLSLLLAIFAPYSLMITCNFALSDDSPNQSFLGNLLFWGGVVVWPGLFSMLFLYYSAYASWSSRRRASIAPRTNVRLAKSRPLLGIFLCLVYFALCLTWTYVHPVHDAAFFASFKFDWGLAGPVRSRPNFLATYALEFAVNLGLVFVFAKALGSFSPWLDDNPYSIVRRLLDLAADSTLGTYVSHPYFLHLPTYLHFLQSVRGRSGLVGTLLVILAAALLFQMIVGPLVNVSSVVVRPPEIETHRRLSHLAACAHLRDPERFSNSERTRSGIFSSAAPSEIEEEERVRHYLHSYPWRFDFARSHDGWW